MSVTGSHPEPSLGLSSGKGKVKVKFTLEQAMKAGVCVCVCVCVEIRLYSFFNLSARWGWVVNALAAGKETRYPLTGGWVVPRAGLEGCRRSYSHLNSNPELSIL